MASSLTALSLSLALALAPTFAAAQSSVIATPLPNAKQTFVDSNGKPLSGGRVYHYVPNTTTPKTTWSDTGETTPNSNPVILDSAGRGTIFGQGNYTQKVTDVNGNVQWNSFTTAVGSSSPSGASGTDTAPVGTIMPFAGLSVPTNWLLAYGQAVSRSTYSDLLTALTISDLTASCTSSSTTISGLSSTAQMAVGEHIEAGCLPTGTTIATIASGTSVTVSNAATATGTFTSTVFPWGNGDGSLTFNLPDMRGRVLAGADAMGGTAASRLTSTYYGASASAPAVSGGAQSQTLAQGNLPNVTLTTTIAAGQGAHTHQTGQSPGSASFMYFVGSGGALNSSAGSNVGTSTETASSTLPQMTGTTPTGGSGTAFGVIQPTITTNYIVKVKSNTTGAGGVVSLGGLTGDIAVDATLRAYVSGGVNYIGCSTATNSQLGCAKPDGTTVTIDGAGTLSAIAGVASQVNIGLTTVSGGTNQYLLYNNSGVLGTRDSHMLIAGTSVDLGGSITASAILDSISSTRGALLERGAATWNTLTPGTAGLPLLSAGVGADPAYGQLNLASAATGILPLANGGTGADLSATGGANSFVKQVSAGAALSVAAITSADLTSALTSPPAIGAVTPNSGKFNSMTLSAITGATQCLQVNASGVVSGTGGACAGGTSLGYYDVTAYGAVADGISGSGTDNTGAFQAAINAASAAGGGVVYVPNTGNNCYGFANPGYLFLPSKVELLGTSTNSSFKRAEGATKGTPAGSVLCPTDTNAGNIFIRFGTISPGNYGGMGVNGITFFYPNQTETNPPIAYPATVGEPTGYPSIDITDAYIVNSVFMNSYVGMYFPTLPKSRLTVQNVTGEFLNRGLVADNVQDWSQIRNFYDEVYVWSANANILAYRLNNNIALDLQGIPFSADGITSEHSYALAQFSVGATSGAGPNGSMTNFHMDDCNNGFIVTGTSNGGVTLTGGELVCTQNGYGIQNAGGNITASNITAWGNFRILYYQTGGEGILNNWNAGAASTNYIFSFTGGTGQLSNILIPPTATATSGALSITGGTDFIVSNFNSIPAAPNGNIDIVAPGAGISNIIFTNNICRATNSIPVSGSGSVKANNLGSC